MAHCLTQYFLYSFVYFINEYFWDPPRTQWLHALHKALSIRISVWLWLPGRRLQEQVVRWCWRQSGSREDCGSPRGWHSREGVRCACSGGRMPASGSCLCHLLAVWPCASCLISELQRLTWKMWVITVPVSHKPIVRFMEVILYGVSTRHIGGTQ